MADSQSIDERRSQAAKLISQKGLLSLAELCRGLQVSESTARRDLEALEQQGIVTRTHGGAVCTRYTSAHSLGFADRQTTMVGEKESIGRTVAGLIDDGQTVILDGGTTCYSVATSLKGRHLSVVTNSVPIASILSPDVATEVTLIGGYIYPRTGVALGAIAQQQMTSLRASLLVLSCAGIGPEGVYNTNQMMVDLDRKMMQSADKILLAVDHSKFRKPALARLGEAHEMDVIVTDSEISQKQLSWLESLDAEIIVAP